jgi:hypothetical protein
VAWKTREVMEQEGLQGRSYWQIISLIRARKIPAPRKSISDEYEWTAADVRRLRQALEEADRRKAVSA